MSQAQPGRTSPDLREHLLLLSIAAAAICVHGYHPYVEDAEIYVPGIKQILRPELFPHNQQFFTSHAHLTLFPNLIAWSVRITGLPFDWALLIWQFALIFLLLLGCWHMGRICFDHLQARWGSVVLVASLLTIPVAGTALYLMDQYVTSRAISTPAVLFLVINTAEKKIWRAGVWAILTAVVHPLMAVFGVSFAVLLVLKQWRKSAALFAAVPFFPPMTENYRRVLESRSYFFLLKWEWYEWLGIFGPLVIFWWFSRIAGRRKLDVLQNVCFVAIAFGIVYFLLAAAITIPPNLARFAELQPLRSLHLLYVLLFVFAGGFLAEFVLKQHVWRWALLFLPLCGGMHYAARQLFPSSPHLELPGRASRNDWVEAFLWIKANTSNDAYFALDPDHMELPGEDQHGFRALAERSMLADKIKDSGAVTMFPELADDWVKQTNALEGWPQFQAADFAKLKDQFAVDWVVVTRPPVQGLACPYENPTLAVCRVP
jgi:hypothetical protein